MTGRPATTLWTHAEGSAPGSPRSTQSLRPVRGRRPGAHLGRQLGGSRPGPAHPARRLRRGHREQGGPADGRATAPGRRASPVRRDTGQHRAPWPASELAAALEWAVQRLGPATAGLLHSRRRCSLSQRQFARQFRDATGTTPHQWLLTQRLALAQRLLETTDQPIDQVAASAGFGTTDGTAASLPQGARHQPGTVPADVPLTDKNQIQSSERAVAPHRRRTGPAGTGASI